MDPDKSKLNIVTLIICIVAIILVMISAVAGVMYFMAKASPRRVGDMRDKAYALAEKHHYTEAEKLYKSAIELAKTNGDALGNAQSSGDLAKVYSAEGSHAEAIVCLNSALTFYQSKLTARLPSKTSADGTAKTPLDQDGAAVLLQLAQEYAKNNQKVEARAKYKEVLSVQNVSSLTDETRNQAAREYGALLRSMGLRMEADQVDIDLAASDDEMGSINDKMQAGLNAYSKKDYAAAERKFRTVLALGKRRHQSNRITEGLIWAGKAEVAERKYPEADSSFEEASSEPAMLAEPATLQATVLSMRAFCRYCLRKPEMPDLVKNALTLDPSVLSEDKGWVNETIDTYIHTGNTIGAGLLKEWQVSELTKIYGKQSLPAVQALYKLSEFERATGKPAAEAHAKDARDALRALLASKAGHLSKSDRSGKSKSEKAVKTDPAGQTNPPANWDQATEAAAYELLAKMDDQANDKPAAAEAIKKSLASLKTNDTSIERARLLMRLAIHLDFDKNPSKRKEVEDSLQEAVKIIDARPDCLYLPGDIFFVCHRMLAEFLLLGDKLPEARAQFARMLPGYVKLNRNRDAAITALAMERIRDKSFDRAHLTAAADRCRGVLTGQTPAKGDNAIGDANAANCWTELADAYGASGQNKLAIDCYKQAAIYCDRMPPNHPLAAALRKRQQVALARLQSSDPSEAK